MIYCSYIRLSYIESDVISSSLVPIKRDTTQPSGREKLRLNRKRANCKHFEMNIYGLVVKGRWPINELDAIASNQDDSKYERNKLADEAGGCNFLEIKKKPTKFAKLLFEM